MATRIRRREFIVALGGAASTWPLAARAQQSATPVVGFLFAGTPEENGDEVTALLRGMSETGFVEGRNVTVEYRWSYNDAGRGREQAADLVNRHVAVIAANVAGAALWAKAATTTIPIVFVAFADAVQVGLVTNLARPGGNVTGINTIVAALEQKRLELLHELVPQALRYGVLVNPTIPAFESDIAMAQSAAKTMGVPLEVLTAATSSEIDGAFARAVQQRVEALAISRSQFFLDRRVQLTTLTVRHALPTIFSSSKFAEVGGLMSYAPNSTDHFRQAGIYVGRILKGDKPADLPVMQPIKFEFVINLQTARTVGLTVPPTMLALADKVIE
jgi:putative tryptophan/tyrosine transport system substrate-binding protein